MIKRFESILVVILLFSSKSLAFNPEYEKQMYIGCYSNSKMYIGSNEAKKYCSCTINMLSQKYTDKEIDLIFKKTPEDIIKATEFASIHCENSK